MMTEAPIALSPADADRVATALRFYIDRVKWPKFDADERAEFERLLAEVQSVA